MIEVCAWYYGCTEKDLTGQRKHWPLVEYRQVAMYLCRTETSASFPTIGRAFNRHHSTVIHGFTRIERCRRPNVERDIARLNALLAANEALHQQRMEFVLSNLEPSESAEMMMARRSRDGGRATDLTERNHPKL